MLSWVIFLVLWQNIVLAKAFFFLTGRTSNMRVEHIQRWNISRVNILEVHGERLTPFRFWMQIARVKRWNLDTQQLQWEVVVIVVAMGDDWGMSWVLGHFFSSTTTKSIWDGNQTGSDLFRWCFRWGDVSSKKEWPHTVDASEIPRMYKNPRRNLDV